MYYLTFSHNRILLSTKVLVLAVVLFVGLLTLGGTANIYAQNAGDAPIVQTETTSEETAQENTQETTQENTDEQVGDPGDSTPNTPNSTDATDTPSGTEVTDDTAEIDTGDATSDLDTTTIENSNDTTTETPSESDTTVTNDNNAEANTNGEVTAETGDNTAIGGGSAEIETGNAVSTANVVNVINTNIFNSTGLFYFLSMLLGNISLDFRNMFSILTGDTPVEGGCALDEPCANSDTTVTILNTNNALVNNDIAVTASTGGNTASASAGDASVQTGDAYASANVLNLVNTNITDSNYLLLTVNNFDAGSGNIIFPGADWFYDLLAQSQAMSAGSQTTVTNTNDATVNTTATVDANTGENNATGTTATVTTGDATAGATVVNHVNQNIFGNSISFLFRIHGSWAGDIFGLPEGMSWRETGDGVEIYFDEAGGATAPAGSTDNLSVTNTNSAIVNNNVSVFALTGENEVSAPDGSASVETGDAMASANVVNIVNTNVLGRNWILAIFNIFGDWDGNIAFGQPDLWIGARALNSGALRGGSCFDYEVTVNNLGDARANNVVLRGVYDKLQQTFDTFTLDTKGRMSYTIGRIDAGGTSVVTLPVCLSGSVRGQNTITTEFEVLSFEDDADDANNREVIGVTTAAGGGGALLISPPNLTITKTADREVVAASSSVTYEITITNTGSPVYSSLLVDTIYNEEGKPVHEQRWGLDTIQSNETIMISYEAFFEESTTPGIYTNKAFVSGADRPQDSRGDQGSPVHSPVATADIEVVAATALTPKVCTPLLSTYIAYLEENDPEEVGKLQFFLHTLEGFSSVGITNIYDEVTYNAVHEFQRRYESDILEPWGMTQSSGYVYLTTQKKINEIWCSDLDFSLTDAQKKEIEEFKYRTRNYIKRNVEVPTEEFTRFGLTPTENSTNDTSRIAVEAIPSIQRPEENTLVQQNNVAAVNQAFTSKTTQSFWASVRNRIMPSLSWLHF
jgi:hypothetical protein